jgi:hypothetical protein
MTAPGVLSYTILDVDMDDARARGEGQSVNSIVLEQLARRFNVSTGGDSSWRSIWIANSTDGKFKNSTVEWFRENLEEGDSILIPYAGDEWEWRNITVKASSLGELCDQDKKKRDPLRIGAPVLTPELLYFHIANEAYRRFYATRVDHGARRNLDLMPGSLRFEKGDELFLPYPIRRQGAIVSATPSNGTTPSATAALAPPWVIQFHDLLKRIDAKAAALAPLNQLCLSYDHEGSQAWAHIAVLHKLVNLQQRDAREFQQISLAKLADLFVTLDDRTRDILYVHGADNVAPDAYNRRMTLANELKALMSMERPSTCDGELSRQDLEANLSKFPRERINHDQLLIEMKDKILARAFLAIEASPLAAYAEETADKVIAELAIAKALEAAKEQTKEGGSASGGAVASIVSTSVGNLPGPSSLAVAFVYIRSFRLVTEAAKAAGDPTKTATLGAAFFNALAAATTVETAETVKKAALSSDPAVVAKAASSIAEIEGKKKVISEAVSANFMVGKGWNLGIALVNLYALYNTIVTYDPNTPRKAVNILGGVVMGGLSVIQLLSSFAPEGAFATLLKVAGTKCSVVAILVSMVSGVVTCVTEDGNTRTAGEFQVASGALSLGGFGLLALGFTPWGLLFVVAGGLAMVASVGYSNADAIKRHWGPGPVVVLREQLGIFLGFSVVQRAESKNAVLKPVVDAILALIKADDASGLHDFDDSQSTIVDELRALPFARSDVDLMMCTVNLQPDPMTYAT